MSDLSDKTTVIVGASRGLGRGIARAFAEAGAPVVAVARTGPALAELAATSANIRTEVADTPGPRPPAGVRRRGSPDGRQARWLGKLEVANRTQAVARARELGLLP
jgi:NAD(P)-dependent dehydrogenase (short-subunit alcohol dehydrogenase family)